MTKREFNKTLKSVSTNNKLDLAKVKKLPIVIKGALVFKIVRERGPIVIDLIPPNFDMQWLASMGYLYVKSGKEYTFRCTSEHQII